MTGVQTCALPIYKRLDLSRILFDGLFIILAGTCFYNHHLLTLFLVLIFILFVLKSTKYHKNNQPFYLDAFIDFLNDINANLWLGMGFDTAITTASKSLNASKSYTSRAIHAISRAILIGVKMDVILEKVVDWYPISEAEQFTQLMALSRETGSNPSQIANITLDKLHMKYKIRKEIETILFQKRLEQTILCLAPMVIILFIRLSAPDYLSILYSSLVGRITMTFALSLILIMKGLSEHIVKIDV